jgi:hypothetical protein
VPKKPNLHKNELNTRFFCSTSPLKAPNRSKSLKLAWRFVLTSCDIYQNPFTQEKILRFWQCRTKKNICYNFKTLKSKYSPIFTLVKWRHDFLRRFLFIETTETKKTKKGTFIYWWSLWVYFMLLSIWQFLISFTYYIDYKHNRWKQLSTNLTHL